MKPRVIDLADYPAWELEPVEGGAARALNIGDFSEDEMRVLPFHSLLYRRETAYKARQIGILLIVGAEQLEPTGLTVTRHGGDFSDAPGTLPTSAQSPEGGRGVAPAGDAGDTPAGAVPNSPVPTDHARATQGAAVDSFPRSGPEVGEDEIEDARRRLGWRFE